MNESTKNEIEIMKAFIDGKVIQRRICGEWEDIIYKPTWDWKNNDYRIKKEPRKFYIVNLYGGLYVFADKECALEFMAHSPTSSLIETVEK